MNKITLLLAFLYVTIVSYFAIFNWNVFLLELDVNLGFREIQLPLIAAIFLIGFIFFILQWLSSSITNIFFKKKLTKTNEELAKVKATQNLTEENKFTNLFNNVDEILGKINLLTEKTSTDIETN